ncbi:hypothetical protein [Neomoorella thermoacetica]|uniref:hypothetical protein n=1 Tax=Neomoorella thermoacetica TaxID=1525 RepID=UPI000924920F|nr:hypothetical protein [Moorella thermoacetica]OIQ10515.1 hypothetical protein MOOTH_25890 [Moorella thermoacetica]
MIEKVHVFTSAATNYLPKVRVLCNSIKQNHPEFTIHLALADEVPAWMVIEDESFDSIIRLEELGIPDLRSWIFRHSLVELCTAIKPFVLRYLFEKAGCQIALYFDPDIVVFSRLDDLLDEFSHGSILLTPHQTRPEQTLEAIMDNEVCSLRHGIFNLGFIGVKNDQNGRAFVEWWCQRLYYFCLAERERGFFVDQKWVDLAPALFEGVRIIRSSRFNVATWNITTRNLAGSWQQGFTVDGQPLGFYHFTGFDSEDHEIMANKYASDNLALKSLIQWYKNNIVTDERVTKMPGWAFASFDNGETITRAHRLIYRMRRDLQNAYPNPFHVIPDGNCYYNWFRWRAAIEHPELFEEEKDIVTDRKLKMTHYSRKKAWRRIYQYITSTIRDYRYGIKLCRKAIAILRTEGLAGLKKVL